MRDIMKIPEKMYNSNVLRGRDLEDSVVATVKGVETITFNQGTQDERDALSITVSGEGIEGEKQFSPNRKSLKVLVDAYGNDTDQWAGKKVRLTPVPSQTPDGNPTTSIAVGVPKSGK